MNQKSLLTSFFLLPFIAASIAQSASAETLSKQVRGTVSMLQFDAAWAPDDSHLVYAQDKQLIELHSESGRRKTVIKLDELAAAHRISNPHLLRLEYTEDGKLVCLIRDASKAHAFQLKGNRSSEMNLIKERPLALSSITLS